MKPLYTVPNIKRDEVKVVLSSFYTYLIKIKLFYWIILAIRCFIIHINTRSIRYVMYDKLNTVIDVLRILSKGEFKDVQHLNSSKKIIFQY